VARNRIEYGSICVTAVALFIFYHNFFFFYLLLAIALLPFASFLLSKYVFKNAKVYVSIPLISVGENNDIPVDFRTENPTRFPMPGVRLEYTVINNFYPNEETQEMSLPLRTGSNTFRWNIRSVYAGRVALTGSRLRMQDYTGLFVFEREWNENCSISVIPERSDIIMNVIENTMTQGDEQENDSSRTVDDVTQVKEFREYRPGDRIQRVNWKISSKRDELYVKDFEQEYNRTLTLLVELRRDTEEIGFLDELLTAFYSAAVKLLDLEMHFRVQWYDCETGRFMTELVSEPDGLDDALSQMYLMKSYTDYSAYTRYKDEPHGRYDTAIYFTSPSFSASGEYEIIGTFKERVTIICF
jgi:uncharacterized protein (DUF58 family)